MDRAKWIVELNEWKLNGWIPENEPLPLKHLSRYCGNRCLIFSFTVANIRSWDLSHNS